MTMEASEKILCPSHKCTSGAQLIGIVQADGRVGFLGQPLPIDRNFVEIATQGRPPELRFRFASPCAKSRCANWGGTGCGIAAGLPKSAAPAEGNLPNCGIRPQCRWFREQGERACGVCPEVVRGSEERSAGR
jgi:hypothetical protein